MVGTDRIIDHEGNTNAEKTQDDSAPQRRGCKHGAGPVCKGRRQGPCGTSGAGGKKRQRRIY